MKKLFLSLSRFLFLACLLLGGIGQAWGEEYYTRVTSGTIGAGTYIITNSNHGIMAANAYVKKPTAITANITYDSGNDKFTADEYTNAHAFTVAAGTNNGLTFKYASTHYLYYKGSGTDFTESNTMSKGHEWTVEFDNGYARIKNVNSTGRAIIWNGSAFAPYATSNISSGNSGTNGGVTYSYVYLYKLTSGTPAKTLQSISVNTPSNKTIYTEGETFAPEGLVITADYGTDGTEDVAYSSNADDFTFSPDLTTALTTSHNSVSITWGEKTCTQEITVNPVSVFPSISADYELILGEDAVADGIFNVTWTAMEDVDVNLYSDEACETEFTGSWFNAALVPGSNNVTYRANENTDAARTVYMQLYGMDAEAETYTHVVAVTQEASTKHTITINQPTNGRVTTDPARTVKANTAVTLTVTPDPGYELDELTIVDASSNSVAIVDGKFTMPNSNVTISATFKASTVPYVALELDFSNAGDEWGLPTSSRSKSAKTFTYGSYSVAFSASDAGYQYQTNLNVIMGKQDASLTLPMLPFAVKKIVIEGPETGASGSVTFNLFVGDNEASTTQTGSIGTKEFVINSTYQVPNTQFVLKITNDNNLQFHSIKFYAASGDANVPTYHTITVADNIVGGVVTPSGKNYIVAGTKIELTSLSKLGYDFVSWNVKDENDNPIEVRNNAFTMPSSNVTVSAVFAAKSNTSVFDLTSSLTDQGATVSADLITFDKDQYTLKFIKGSGTAVNNYIPTKNDNVRLYTNNTVQITPKSGYKIKQVHFDMASSSGGQSNWEGTGVVLTNCTIDRGNAANGLPGYVKVLPIDMCGIASVKLKGNTNIIGVMVEYAKSDISVNTNGDDTYYATFSSVRDVEFKSCQVFTVNVSGTSLVLNEISDKKVPANTGVLIKATSADAVAFDYLSTPPSAISGTNLLAAGTGVEDNDANYKYYKFAYNNYTAKTGLGFYYANEGGTSITCPIGKAYLKVPTGDGAPTRFVFDEIKPNNPITTDVEAVNKYVDTKKMLVRGQLVIVRGNKMFDMNGRLVK